MFTRPKKNNRPQINHTPLNHTVQTKLEIGKPNDKYEQEADQVAEQVMMMPEKEEETIQMMPGLSFSGLQMKCKLCENKEASVQTKLIQRSPFDSEDPAHRERRLAVIGLARSADQKIRTALSSGYLWDMESISGNEVFNRTTGSTESLGRRETRLRELLSDLIGLVRDLEAGPIPTAWLAPEIRVSWGTINIGSERDPIWQDIARFYTHRGVALGRNTDTLLSNIWYMRESTISRRAVTPTLISRGVRTGIYIAVPDPEYDPLTFTRVTGFTPLPGRGVILDVWNDDFGYYYLYGGAKHYLPGRP